MFEVRFTDPSNSNVSSIKTAAEITYGLCDLKSKSRTHWTDNSTTHTCYYTNKNSDQILIKKPYNTLPPNILFVSGILFFPTVLWLTTLLWIIYLVCVRCKCIRLPNEEGGGIEGNAEENGGEEGNVEDGNGQHGGLTAAQRQMQAQGWNV
jgi:hypothetical protein